MEIKLGVFLQLYISQVLSNFLAAPLKLKKPHLTPDERGRQKRNLTLSEQRGVRKIEKRKNDGEVVVIMTDKSSKMCIMKRDDYEKMGEEHVGKDREVKREEILEREKILNQHSLSWCKMWRTGADHGHEDRIRQSKITNSENRAELYLSYKDHKKALFQQEGNSSGHQHYTNNTVRT